MLGSASTSELLKIVWIRAQLEREKGVYQYQAEFNKQREFGTDHWYSDVVTVEVTKPAKPEKPTSLSKAGQQDPYDGSYEVQWDAPASGDYDYYLVQERKDQSSWCFNQQGSIHGYCYAQKGPISTRSYTTNDRDPGSYQYRVFACNEQECSDPFETNEILTVDVQPSPTPTFDWLEPASGEYLRYQQNYTLTVGNNGSEGVGDGSVHFYRLLSGGGEEQLNIPVNYDNQCGCWKASWPAAPLGKVVTLIAEMENQWEVSRRKSIVVTIGEPPVVSVAEVTSPVTQFDKVKLTVTASDSGGGSVQWVKIFVDTEVAHLTSPPYEYEWTPQSAGGYTIYATAEDDDGEESSSGQQIVHVDPILPPDPPGRILIDAQPAPFPVNTSGSYTASWDPVAGATNGYVLEECVEDGMVGGTCDWDPQNPNFHSYSIPSGISILLPNQSHGYYRYRVRACNDSEQGCGDPSAEFPLSVQTEKPAAPGELAASSPHGDFDLIGNFTLSWEAVTGWPEPTYYKLEEKTGGADSEDPWEPLSHNSLETEFPVEDRLPGVYSYRLNACNHKGCTESGEILTINVLPPALLSADLDTECGEQCLRIASSGLDPDSAFTITDRQSGAQQSIDPAQITWQAPVSEEPEPDPTTYARLPLDASMLEAFKEKEGLHIAVENLNGERAAIDAYGDTTVERLSQIDSAPAVGADGTIYVGSGSNVYALNPEDGTVVSGWPFATGDQVKATPMVDSTNGNIYVGSLDDNLYALTPLGLEQWRLQTGDDIVASAVIDENRILYQGSMDGVLYAVQAQNGAVQWVYGAGAGIAETPVLAGNGTLYFTTVGSSQVYALGRGDLGPDQLNWGSVQDSQLRDKLDDEDWQPNDSQRPQYLMAARLYRLLLQPELPLSREVLTFYTYALVHGASLQEVAAAFLGSDTGKSNFSSPTNEGFVDELYRRAFPGQEQPPFTYSNTTYTRSSLLDAMTGDNGLSRAQVAVLFAQSLEYAGSTDELLSASFGYFYDQDYSWAAFSCDHEDPYVRDCDEDGLPDYWEILFFGDIESESGGDDADGDGHSNLEALLANQDPCANQCSYGVTEQAPDPAPMPTLDMGQVALSGQIGSLSGNFRVNESGATTYQMPLGLPAGTAGVAPQLSLNYSSQSGNGLLGHGWALGGLSTINRCRQTLGQDGEAKPITWEEEDRFCLDGQRLLVVQGEYGADGSRYRTEIDSFALVRLRTNSGGRYFTVERKDGSISYYGEHDDTKQTTNQGTLTWAISKFEDSAQNRIEFIYEDDGGHHISEIRYAYTDPGGTRESSNYSAQVLFDYQDRQDPIRGYLAGELLETGKRIAGIRVYNDNNAIRRYELEYLDDPRDRLSRLARLRQCADSICQPCTEFDWRLPLPGSFASSAKDSVTFSESMDEWISAGTRPADINGDGRMDLIWLNAKWDGEDEEYKDQVFKYVLATEDGFGSERTALEDSSNLRNPFRWEVFDYNADGRADLAYYDKDGGQFNNGQWFLLLSVPDSSGSNWHLSGSPIALDGLTDEDIRFADLNGDGLVDAISALSFRLLEPDPEAEPTSNRYYHFGNNRLLQLEGFESWGDFEYPRERVYHYIDPAASGDFNGDGRIELVLWDTKAIYKESDGKNFERQHSRAYRVQIEHDPVSGWHKLVNRGKLLDYVQEEDDFLRLEVRDWETGDRHIVRQDTEVKDEDGPLDRHQGLDRKIHTADINGDGLTDMIIQDGLDESLEPDTARYSFRLSTGNGFLPPEEIGIKPEKAQLQWFDYDNDGLSDLVWREAGSLRVNLWRSHTQTYAGGSPFRNAGSGSSVQHIFTDMDGDGVTDYVWAGRDSAAFYPATAFRTPVNVIDKITNGLGAETAIEYGALSNSGHYARLFMGNTMEERCHFQTPAQDPQWCSLYQVPSTANFYSALNDPWEGSSDNHRLGKPSPTLELMGPMYVVTQVESSAPTVGNSNDDDKSKISYYYAQAKVQAGGRGMLGFEQLRTVDEQSGIETITSYRQDFPFIGYPIKTEVRTADGRTLSRTVNTWQLKNTGGQAWNTNWPQTAKNDGSAALGPLQPWLAESVEEGWDLHTGEEPLKTVTTENQYDQHGNPGRITVTTVADNDDTFTTDTTNIYGEGQITFNNPDHVLSSYPELGRLTKTTVIHSRDENGESDVETRTSAFSYYPNQSWAGLLEEEIIEPDAQGEEANLKLTTSYTYDEFGNKVSVTQTADGEEPRISRWEYLNGDGRYLKREINVYGQITYDVIARNELGLPLEVKDITGVSTHFEYDAFGRRVLEYNETGAHVKTLLSAPSADHCLGSVYQRRVTGAGGGLSLSCFDVLARETRSATIGFDGDWVYADTEYDELGRVSRKSEPYSGSPGSAPYWTQMDYDDLGRRVVGTDLPGTTNNNSHQNAETGLAHDIHVEYSGYTTVATNPEGHSKTEIRNALGELVKVEDELGGTLEYRYDAQGNPLRVARTGDEALLTTETQMVYDKLGRKESMNDPDKGSWEYDYNGFGELIRQQDAKGQMVENHYDKLGRLTRRTDYRQDGSIEGDTYWDYNNGGWLEPKPGFWIAPGALDNVMDIESGYIRAHYYDTLGRPELTSYNLSLEVVTDNHGERTTYDRYGRVFQQFDAAGDGFTRSATQNIYNNRGYLEAVVDGENINQTSAENYYTVLEMDERGNVTRYRNGNGVVTERFYDPETGRLEHQTASIAGELFKVQDLTYQWDNLGNLEHRIDKSGAKELEKDLEESFEYDKLNRLKSAQVAGREAQSITYDGLGNIKSKSDVGDYRYGGRCTQGYGPHALCETEDGNGNIVTYSYDANGNMKEERDKSSGTLRRELQYSTFDKPLSIAKDDHTTEFKYGPDRSRYLRIDTDSSGKVTETRYIGNVEKITRPDNTVEVKRYLPGGAVVTTAGGERKSRYLHKDHLGSVDVITDNSGSVIQAMSFDSWGQRRNTQNWEDLIALELGGFDTGITTRGYTGHEMLDQVGLIHMNGRIYDARLARFLQADPFIQYPDFTQSYNRYSYVFNNPLNAIDPSGYLSLSSLMDIVVVVVAVVVEVVCRCGAGWEIAAYWFSGPSGVAHAAEAGMNAFINGNYGAAALYIAAAYFSTTGIKGGGAGGEGAGIASASGGGTASAMTDGKFANAAYTGSAMSALNAKEGPGGGDTDLSGYALFAYVGAALLDEDKEGRSGEGSPGSATKSCCTPEETAFIEGRISEINESAGLVVGKTADDAAKWLDANTQDLRMYKIEFGAGIKSLEGGSGFDALTTDWSRSTVNLGATPAGNGYTGRWHSHPAGSYFSSRDISNAINNGVNSYVSRGGGLIDKFSFRQYLNGAETVRKNAISAGMGLGQADTLILQYRSQVLRDVSNRNSPYVNSL